MGKIDTKTQGDKTPPMTKKEALDILLQNVAESKKQIAQGHYYTHEEVWAMLHQRKTTCK